MDVQNLKKQVALIAAKAIELRRELHRFPEPGNGETRTAKIIEKELANLRLKPEYLLETGLISTIFAGNGFDAKETVGLRADIDGLPIKETLNLPFVSLNEGYMHACGHDVHTAVLLGTAMVLAKNKHELRRNVRLIFQPAEETTGGAERMIAAGCLAEPDVTSIYGLHIMPELTAGQIGIRTGCVHAGSDMFQIHVKGKGSHGASPEMGIDALLTGCQIVSNLQTIVSRSIDATHPAVLTVGSFESGTAGNIIAEEAFLKGIIRTIEPGVGRLIKARTEEIVRYTSAAAGAEGTVKFQNGYPALFNETASTERVHEITASLVGEENCISIKKPSMRVDDFSYYLNNVKGSYFFLGSGFSQRENPPIHSGDLYVNEKCIEVGIMVMSALCLL